MRSKTEFMIKEIRKLGGDAQREQYEALRACGMDRSKTPIGQWPQWVVDMVTPIMAYQNALAIALAARDGVTDWERYTATARDEISRGIEESS
jgi:hypothetical protein